MAIEERIYIPGSIEDAYANLPAVGRTIRITYRREYVGTNGERVGKNRAVTRKAVMVQKTHKHFTVEMIAENRDGYRGGYRLGFMLVDLVTGRVKIREVDG